MRKRLESTRGAILAIVIATAFMASIAAYAALLIASSQARQGAFARGRTEARYLAEAGLVIAMQQLAANPAYCGATERVDTNWDGVANASDPQVVVTVTSCGANNAHTLRATVTY